MIKRNGLNTLEVNSPTTTDESCGYEQSALRELRSAGLRITMPRVQVIRTLANSKRSLTAYEVHEQIIQTGGKIDVVSVYRILATLEEIGLIHHIGLVNGYFPARVDDRAAKKSQVVVLNNDRAILELRIPQQMLDMIEEQSRAHGFEAEVIKIEILASAT